MFFGWKTKGKGINSYAKTCLEYETMAALSNTITKSAAIEPPRTALPSSEFVNQSSALRPFEFETGGIALGIEDTDTRLALLAADFQEFDAEILRKEVAVCVEFCLLL